MSAVLQNSVLRAKGLQPDPAARREWPRAADGVWPAPDELQLWHDRYTELFDTAPCGYVTCNAEQRIVNANRTFAASIGLTPEDLVDRPLPELLAPTAEDRDAWARHWNAASGSTAPAAADLRLRRGDGTWVDVHLTSQSHFDGRGRLFECRTMVADITELRQAEARLRESEAFSRSLFDRTTNPIFVIDEAGLIVDANAAAEHFLDIERQDLLGRTVPACFCLPAAVPAADILQLLREECAPVEIEACTTGGQVRIAELAVTRVTRNGRALLVALGTDVTGRKVAESTLRHEVLHDNLTKLPNRSFLHQSLDLAVKRRRRHPAADFAILFLDVDGFKAINDAMGHVGGDQILVAIASRLRHCVREVDIVARLGGDEFVVLIDAVRGDREATVAAERILEAMREPFRLDGKDVRAGVSIGIAVASTCAETEATAILREADAALYRAKGCGRGRYAYANDRPLQTDSMPRQP